MKKYFLSGIFALGLTSTALAQFSEDFNAHSNRNALVANCWEFFGTDVTATSAIAGVSTRSGQASSLTNKKEVRTPFLDIKAGATVTFRHKMSSYGNFGYRLEIVLEDVNGVQSPVQFQHFYTNGNTLSATVNLTQAGVYRVAFQHSGTGGTGRGHIDDIVITNATYVSSPSNGCKPAVSNPDSDGDGVPDAQDEFPNDPTLAYTTSTTVGYGSYAFEDLWPFKGDFDFNDMVVDYKFTYFHTPANTVKYVQAKLVTKAVGGVRAKTLGIQFSDLLASNVSSVSGQVLNGFTTRSGNGTEAGQTKAVVIAFDDVEEVINRVGGAFYNTIKSQGTGVSDTVSLIINFTTPQDASKLLSADLFVILDNDRGLEIHKNGFAPTALANPSFFGTGDDASSFGQNRFYRTENNLPWVIETPVVFAYPAEKVDLLQAYLNFATWATSNGTQATNWYTAESGNRNLLNIF